MATLTLHVLGPFQALLDGQAITHFSSNKVRALLAYLAVESDRPHSREALATLLFPDWADRAALSNLRYVLSDLRQALGDAGHGPAPSRASLGDAPPQPPFLHITREMVQFNTASDHWVDVLELGRQAQAARETAQEQESIHWLASCASLYKGSFLEGFSVGDSAAFEEWVSFKRDQVARQVQEALHQLAALLEQRDEYEQALRYARRQLELEPWQEEAHQQVMRLLAQSGQRSKALAQYEACRRLLANELGIEPALETTALYEQIRRGALAPPARARAAPPETLLPASPPLPQAPSSAPQAQLFVARQRELRQLDAHLERALAEGVGQVVFVIGEAGSGKTALVTEFVQQAMATHPALVPARGHCSAQAGMGDPYLPFREIFGMLSGDVEPRRAGGALTPEHARRLWATLPSMARALVHQGPDLVGPLIPGADLALRAESYAPEAPWRASLDELIRRKAGSGEALVVPSTQAAVLFQVTRVLHAVAEHHPLVLVLDDLQWADASSINLLFHLGKSLANGRILLIGAYRPDEIALGRDGARHPLESVIHELQRDHGDITVDLSQVEGRQFIDALLDAEPNRLGSDFREMLYRRTGGQALYTVELLRGLRERGDLRRDEPETVPGPAPWVQGPALNWDALPARVEAVIAERIGRLSSQGRALLDAASVEGEEFTAEVVARALAADEAETARLLSGELSHPHNLVRAVSLQRLGYRRLSRYRFSHYLHQQYLYTHLDDVHRAHLHEAVGRAQEELFAAQLDEIANQLAWHWQEAGLPGKAAHYLLRAGSRALKLSASEESVAHLLRGVALLQGLPISADRARQELALQLALAQTFTAARGWGSPERARACVRAYELAREIGDPATSLQPYYAMADLYIAQGKLRQAVDMGQQLLALAQSCHDPLYVAMAHDFMGMGSAGLGQMLPARDHLESAVAGSLAMGPLVGQPYIAAYLRLSALQYLSIVSLATGYPDRAVQLQQQMLTEARQQDHPLYLGYALLMSAVNPCLLRNNDNVVQDLAQELADLGAARGLPIFHSWGMFLQGWVQSRRGQAEQGIARMRRAVADWQAGGAATGRPFQLVLMADACLHAGEVEQGLRVVSEALAFAEQSEMRLCQAELHRLQGELLRSMGDSVRGSRQAETLTPQARACYRQAEPCFQRALAVARHQGARLWELRAALGLVRLQERQDPCSPAALEARRTLASVFDSFTEGFALPDLQEARAILDSVAPR